MQVFTDFACLLACTDAHIQVPHAIRLTILMSRIQVCIMPLSLQHCC